MAFVHATRPSYVRIRKTNEMETCDGMPWRVSIYVTENNVIREIRQEVEVGLPEGFRHGGDLSSFLRTGELHPISDTEDGGISIINVAAVRKLMGEQDEPK